jgi:hypothetical protein
LKGKSGFAMRVGQNPAKFIQEVTQPQAVTVALITYLPFLSGYYAQGLDVLRVCLESVWQNTDAPYDLLVFDNASCREVRSYLLEAWEAGRIQYLVLSERNLGKSGAWNFIFGAAPGEYIAYADSDVYFHPGWLTAHLRVFEHLPQVGMVTGQPLLNPEEYSTSTLQWAEAHPEVRLERGKLLPWEDYWRHAGSLGREEAQARAFYEQHEAVCLHVQGETYYVGAGHFQFVAPRRVLQRALPLPSERPMGQVRALDVAINAMGFLRLCTAKWWVEHLGNTLEGWQPVGVGATQPTSVRQPRQSGGLWSWKPIRILLTRIHHKTFELLYRR